MWLVATSSRLLFVCLQDRIKGRVARVLALCHMGLGSTPQAASYCSIADSYEPGDVSTSFIRFKLLLLQGDQAGALAELQHMAQCRGFSTPMLWVSGMVGFVAGVCRRGEGEAWNSCAVVFRAWPRSGTSAVGI